MQTENLTCSKHESNYVALCNQCNEGLCIDCLFDHKSFKDHEYDKLSKLKEKWILDLNKFLGSTKENNSTPANKNKEKANSSNAEILKDALIKLEKIQNELKNTIDGYFNEFRDQLVSILKSDSVSKEAKFNYEYPLKIFPSKKEEVSFFVKELENGNELENYKLLKYFNQNHYKENLEYEKNRMASSDFLDLQIKTPLLLYQSDAITSKLQEFLIQNINFTYENSTIKRLISLEDKKMSSFLPWFFENTNFLLIYEVKEKKIFQYQIKDFLVPFNHRCIVTRNNTIYLLGGIKPDTEKPTNELFVFDSKNNTMRAKFNMKEPRYGHALCYIPFEKEEFIYCIGGRSSENRLSSVERYNVNENSWKKIQKLNFPRVGCCAASNKKSIFVFGGLSEKDNHNKSIEVYNINDDKWDTFEFKNSVGFDPLIDSSCFFLNESNLVIFGGGKKENHDIFFRNSIIFYNIEQNTMFLSSANKEDFPFYFLGDNITIHDKMIYLMVKLRTESKKFGPFQKAVIGFDFNRNQWKFDQMVEFDQN